MHGQIERHSGEVRRRVFLGPHGLRVRRGRNTREVDANIARVAGLWLEGDVNAEAPRIRVGAKVFDRRELFRLLPNRPRLHLEPELDRQALHDLVEQGSDDATLCSAQHRLARSRGLFELHFGGGT